MLLDEILDLHMSTNPKERVRDCVARLLNYNFEHGDNSAFLMCGILPFRSPGYKVTSATADLVKCILPELIQFPPYSEEKEKATQIITEKDYLAAIL